MKIGIIGLPNVGKSSLFNLLTDANAQVAKFPFTTIEKNLGMVVLPDKRLKEIVEKIKPKKVTYGQIQFIDIAGLIKGAALGEGLGNKFLAHIREVDLVLHVLRCFKAADIPHTDEQIVPARDYEIVRSELFLSDLAMVERRIDKVKKKLEYRDELVTLNQIKETLSKGEIPSVSIQDLPLLSTKEEIIVLNLDQDGIFNPGLDGYRISVKLEQEIQNFTEEERQELRKEAGLESTGIFGLIKACLKKLSIIIFYTIKGDETRAWPIKKGTKIQDAAGMIHTDMKKGFIKAEVIDYNSFIETDSFAQAQQLGKTRIQGKDYIVQDGDIILIKFRK